jgi:hypothetical protein
MKSRLKQTSRILLIAKIADATLIEGLVQRVPPPPSKFSSNRSFIASPPHSPPSSSSIVAPSSPVRQRAPSFTETETEPSSSQEPKKNLTSDEIHSLLVSCLLSLGSLSSLCLSLSLLLSLTPPPAPASGRRFIPIICQALVSYHDPRSRTQQHDRYLEGLHWR